MLPVLLGLGTWQVHRLHWKQGLLAEIADRTQQPAVDISLMPADADYRPAKAIGTFRNDLQLFVFATDVATGQGGYRVLTPLQLASGKMLLVDRGWIPYVRRSDNGFVQPVGQQSARGILRVPTGSGWITPANNPAKGEWYSIDLAAMAAVDHVEAFLPYVLEVEKTPDGVYPVGGQTRLTLPNDHRQYAITWYGLTVVLVIIYLVSSFQRNGANRSKAK